MKNKFVIFLIIILTIIKLQLIGVGFFAFPDEERYLYSIEVVKKISAGNYFSAIQHVFSRDGRPGDVILQAIPASIQLLTAQWFNLELTESRNTIPLFIFNFLIYCLILFVHFKFSKLFLKDHFLALISVVLLSCLTNSYLYIRHALPYDLSLLIFYLIIYKIAKYTLINTLSFKKSFLLGVFTFFGFTVYPGYFPLLFVASSLLCFNNLNVNNLKKRCLFVFYYILGAIACLFMFELVSRKTGVSYIRLSYELAGTINQGSFEESFSFIFKYLINVEGVLGVLLIFGLIVFSFCIFYKLKEKKLKLYSFEILTFFLLLAVFIIYAFVGFFLHKMVLYGRLLHQYFPFIVVFTVYAINELTVYFKFKKKFIFLLVLIPVIAVYLHSIFSLYSLAYPRDICWEMSNKYNFEKIEKIYEYDMHWPIDINIKSKTDTIQNQHLVLVNPSYFYPLNDINNFKPFKPYNNLKLVFSSPHFLNYKAYQYEGFSIDERQNISQMNLQIKLYSF